jgi:transposase
MDTRRPYPGDLTDREWSQVERFIPAPKPGGRPAKYDRREVVKRTEPGFKVLKRRWVVERTFAWLGRCRRLSKDYEGTTGSSQAWVKLAMVHLMARRLVRKL